MVFDYEIQYKCGSENKAADALSRVQGSEILLLALSLVTTDLEAQIKASYHLDAHLLATLQKISIGEIVQHYSLLNGLLRRKNRLVIRPVITLRKAIIDWHHLSSEAGHPGRDGTTVRVKRLYYWKGVIKDIN